MNGQSHFKHLGLAVGLLAVVAVVAACGSSNSGAGAYGATPTQAAAGGTETVMAKTVGGQTILVAGSNGMTVYTFTKDTAGSGQSACTGACLVKWPPLTVATGSTPTAGAGVSGTLGTITSPDGTMQVTFNGLPLYFYQGDKAAGDTTGSYPNWNLVKP